MPGRIVLRRDKRVLISSMTLGVAFFSSLTPSPLANAQIRTGYTPEQIQQMRAKKGITEQTRKEAAAARFGNGGVGQGLGLGNGGGSGS